jgi:hypothetical protein
MKNTILLVTALLILGACSSEPKDEVGRYVPIVNQDYYPDECGILDTKTGVIYLYLKKTTGLQKGGKHKFKYEFIKINPIDKKITITKAN